VKTRYRSTPPPALASRPALASNRVRLLSATRVRLLLTLLALFLGCSRGNADSQQEARVRGDIPMGQWRVVLTVPGGDLPFYLDLTGSPDEPEAFYVNGSERTRVPEVTINGTALSLFIPSLNSTIEAELKGGELLGTLRVVKLGGIEQVIPLRATYAQGYVYSVPTKTEVDITGRWSAQFTPDGGQTYPAIGEFTQKEQKITGTFLTPVGDHRFLAGEMSGREFYLSCFDGGHTYLFKGRVDDDGNITGGYWDGLTWHESWVARRDENATLPDPYSLTYLKDGYDTLSFTFPRTDGTELSFPSDAYAGHVVILALEGTWCRNCSDEAPFLVDVYRRYQDRGLDVIGLMYERYRDFDRAARQVERYRAHHAIEYDLVVAGFADKKEASQTLPMLDRVAAFPTMIVIDRAGKVRKIHTGFSGPGTGAHYEDFVRGFEALLEGLLSEGSSGRR